jgi:uncharacterized protein YfaS (alpha-2-macroglobulin family)
MKLTSFSVWLLAIVTGAFSLAFNSHDDDFMFYLYSNKIYTPGDNDISVYLNARSRERVTVKMRAYRIVDPIDFFLAQTNPHSPGEPDTTQEGNPSRIDVRNTRRFTKVAEWEHDIKRQRDYWYGEQISIPLKEKGVYVVQAIAKGKEAATVVVVTEYGMIVKQSKSEALAFILNRKTGEKVAGVPVAFAHGKNKAVRATGGADGVARASITGILESKNADNEEWDPWGGGGQLLAIAEKDGNFAISDSYYYRYYGGGGQGVYQMYLHTDRPVYRPSQLVYYRGITRKIEGDGSYSTVADKKVEIDITDTRGASIGKDTLTLSDFGTFNGSVTLAEEPPLGTYTIKATVDGEPHTFTFDVEEYKKPEYEVVVTTDKQQYTRGDEINATVKADYYFGSPVAEGEVQYFVFRSRFYRPWWYGSRWSYLYEFDEGGGDRYAYYGGSEMVHSGNGKLKSDGTFSFSYRTDKKADDDYVYRVQANVVDASRRSISGATSVKVTRGEFYLTAQTDRYLYKPGDKAIVTVYARTFDGDAPAATAFDVTVQRNWWDSRRSHDEKVWSGSGQTGSDGVGTVQFATSESGYYNVMITAKDSRGNEITTSQSMYVADQNWAYWDQGGGVRIIPDREMYKPGDMMSALIIMPEAGMDALVTLEGSTIFAHQVQRVSSTSAIVRFPIEERYAPNIYLSVAALRGDQFHSTQSRVSVTPEKKVITIQVVPGKKVYKPGETGTVTVRAVDNTGEPVANVDIALAVVDEAIYAIRPDATKAIEQFFYGARSNEVNTNTSLYFHFYNQAVQAQAEDMAVGSAANGISLRGGRNGEVAMKLAAPSAAPPVPDFVQPVVRSDFRDLMFWTPSVRTGTDGSARVEVKFPDNLTTWRMTARGVTRATQVGQATAEVIARKDLLVRMETPRFITQGDELLIATTVHNYLSTGKQTKVQFSASGVELKEHERTVTIAANGEQRIDWKITAPKTGEAKFTVKALTDEESDAMELKVPILPRGVKSATSATANLDGASESKSLALAIPSNADVATGEMFINLSPSAASSILGALDDLIGYPYGCVEQTMSRFLPTVVVADALGKIDVPFDAAKREELPKMVAKGLTRLYNLQHSDGGWGWWEHDQTNPFMTAYVMYGMTVAKRAGHDVDEDRYQRGIGSLLSQIESRPSGGGLGSDEKRLNNTTEAYMLYVASFVNSDVKQDQLRKRISALAKVSDINNYGKALLALAAHQYGDKSTASSLAATLEANATTSGTGAHWKGAAWHYNWQDDEVETSAYVIKALLKIKGETELVEKGIQWLLAQKTGDSWNNTRQTAMVVYTIVDYVQNSKELNPEYTVAVNVNGREVFRQAFTRRDVFGAEKQIKIPAKDLVQGNNSVTIQKSGEGRLYVAARLVYFATGPAIQPASAGFTVEREYFLLKRKKSGGKFIYEKERFKGEVKSGDELFVKVKIRPDARYEYFMLEDPLPAGCEVVTETSGYTIPGEQNYGESNGGGYYRDFARSWNWWYADRDVRDEKVAFFAQQMMPQEYEFSYVMRAQIPGSYSVMPSVGALMYYPEVRGNSAAIAMRITE